MHFLFFPFQFGSLEDRVSGSVVVVVATGGRATTHVKHCLVPMDLDGDGILQEVGTNLGGQKNRGDGDGDGGR